MHTMCSYHGMFPAKVAHYFIQRYSRPGDLVVDPFSGRGTTALQARVEGRRVVGNDLSPLAYVLTAAKANPPGWVDVNRYVDSLEQKYRATGTKSHPSVSPDIAMLYHENTLSQLCFIRSVLLSKPITAWSPSELMVGGSLAGIMHGSWRRDGTSQYLSISMPNTFSMSPRYVEKFIKEHALEKIDQDVFERLRDKLARLYLDGIPGPDGAAYNLDAAGLMGEGPLRPQSVDLIVTSPPYLRVVNYAAANWIRLWLLGVDDVGRDAGAGRKQLNAVLDHGHSYDAYKEFMLRTILSAQDSLKPNGVAAFVIGDVADPGKEPVPLAAQLWEDISARTNLRLVELLEDDLPAQNKVSRIWGDTKGQATNRDCTLVLTHRDGAPEVGDATVSWDEPYRDAGPDAAHSRHRMASRR
jgi:site-specific DNA-methyltransferase (adenine-specific)